MTAGPAVAHLGPYEQYLAATNDYGGFRAWFASATPASLAGEAYAGEGVDAFGTFYSEFNSFGYDGFDSFNFSSFNNPYNVSTFGTFGSFATFDQFNNVTSFTGSSDYNSFTSSSFDSHATPFNSYGYTGFDTFSYSSYDPLASFTDFNYTYDQAYDYSYNYSYDYSYNYTYDFSYNYSYDYTDYSYDYSWGWAWPVVLDLTGQGLDIAPQTSSATFYDMSGDGLQHSVAWAGVGNGVLAFDANGDGLITESNEIAFTEWDHTADSDMQALANVFDTDGDGALDAGDARFSSFRVMVTNADGSTTLQTLAQAGIQSIGLRPTGSGQSFADGSAITGTTTFTRTDGSTGRAGDAVFAAEGAGHVLSTTTTLNGDGSTTRESLERNVDGSRAGAVRTTVSADGSHTVTQHDDTGNGIFNRYQTTDLVTNGDGSRTQTTSDYDADNTLGARTVTLRSADGGSATISLDRNGDGAVDQTEQYVTNADGSTVTTVSDFNPDGSLSGRTISTASADGLSNTIQRDLSGSGVFDLTTTEVTVVNGDGSRTGTVTDLRADGSLQGRTVTTTSADGRSRQIQFDRTGSGTFDSSQNRSIVVNADNSSVATITDFNADGSLRARSVTTLSADGLTQTVQSDPYGTGAFTGAETRAVVVGADLSRVETVTNTYGDGSLAARTVTSLSGDRRTISVTDDVDGDGITDRTILTTPDADGITSAVDSTFNANGSLRSRTVVTASADGFSTTTQEDLTGSGSFNRTTTDITTANADGSRTKTLTTTHANGSLREKVVVTTSANGRSTVTQADDFGLGSYNRIEYDTVTVGADLSRTEDFSGYNGNGTLRARTVMTTSADGLSTTTQMDRFGLGTFDTVLTDMTVVNADRSRTQTITETNANGSTRNQTTIEASSDSRTVTTRTDIDGDGQSDQVTTAVAFADGHGVVTDSTLAANAALLGQTVTTTSASGLSVTTQRDVTGDAVFDETETDVTVLNSDGSRTETVTRLSANGTLLDRTVILTSANGLNVTTDRDTAGLGSFTSTTTDQTVALADGSTVETITTRNGDGSLRDRTVITADPHDKMTSTTRDGNGDGLVDQSVTQLTNADGSVTTTTNDFNGNGSLRSSSVATASADGLTTTTSRVQDDHVTVAGGSARFTMTTTDQTVLASDGSTVETITNRDGSNGLLDRTVVTRSANGLSIVTQADVDGSGTFDEITYETGSVGSDGGRTETIADYNGNGTLRRRSVETTNANGLVRTTQVDVDGNGTFDGTTTSVTVHGADGREAVTETDITGNGTVRSTAITTTGADRTQTVQTDSNGDGVFDQWRTTAVASDGSTVTTLRDYNVNGSLRDRAVITTSANGLSRTVQRDTTGSGNLVQTQTDVTTINADGSRTRTVTDFNANGTVRDRLVTTTSANSLSTTTSMDMSGSGNLVARTTTTIVLNADGSKLETVGTYNADGTYKSGAITTTSADGQTVTVQDDLNGDSVFEQWSQQTVESDGSTVTTLTDYGALRTNRTVVTTSANGLHTVIQRDTVGDNAPDQITFDTTCFLSTGATQIQVAIHNGTGALVESMTVTTSRDQLSKATQWVTVGVTASSQTDVTVLEADGSRKQTVTRFDVSGAMRERSIVDVSDDQLVTTRHWDRWDAAGAVTLSQYQTDVSVLNADGTRSRTVESFESGGTLISRRMVTTSADGRTTRTELDPTGAGPFTHITVAIAVANLDGSSTETVSNHFQNGSYRDRTVTTISADKRTTTVTRDLGGSGPIEQTDVTVFAIDGSRVQTVSDFNASGALQARTVVSTSADGRTVKTERDVDGNGSIDCQLFDVSVENADGSKKQTLTEYKSNGSLSHTTTIATSADRRTISRTEQFATWPVANRTEVTQIAIDGSAVVTAKNFNSNGSLKDQTITNISADGLTTSMKRDTYGTGFFDHYETTGQNVDGSAFTKFSDYHFNGSLAGDGTITRSADGLTTLLERDTHNLGIIDYTEETVINVDGSRKVTTTEFNGNGSVTSRTVTTVSADGYTRRTEHDAVDGGNALDRLEVTKRNGDGSTLTTFHDFHNDGSVANSGTIEKSADGLVTTLKRKTEGATFFDHIEVTVTNADGSILVTTSDYHRNQLLRTSSRTTISADGRTQTTWTDLTGSGAYDDYHETTTTALDGTVTTNFTNYNDGGTAASHGMIIRSADGRTRTVLIDTREAAIFDHREVTVVNADGSSVKTVDLFEANGTSLRSTTTTRYAADGRSWTVERKSNGINFVDHYETTTVNADGSTTTVFDDRDLNNSVRARGTIVRSANGLTTRLERDSRNVGFADHTEDTIVNPDGSQTITTRNLSPGGVLVDQTVRNVAASGGSLATSTSFNADGSVRDRTVIDVAATGDGWLKRDTHGTGMGNFFDHWEWTTEQPSGASTTIVNDFNRLGGLLSIGRVFESADGQTRSTYTNTLIPTTSDLTWYNRSEIKVALADGSATTTIQNFHLNNSLRDRTIIETSANNLTTTLRRDSRNTNVYDHQETTTTNTNGTTTTVVRDFELNGTQRAHGTITRSADGLTTNVVLDSDYYNGVDHFETILTNADGSTKATHHDYSRDLTRLLKFTEITTSADRYSSTLKQDTLHDGVWDHWEWTTTNLDGSTKVVTNNYYTTGALKDQETLTIAASGLSRVSQKDTDANGHYDRWEWTTVNADGSSKIETKNYRGDGSLKDTTTTTVNGFSRELQQHRYENHIYSRFEQTTENLDGSTRTTFQDYKDGALDGHGLILVSGDRITTQLFYDDQYDGFFERQETTVVNGDGSSTRAVAMFDNDTQQLTSYTTTPIPLVA